MLANAARLCEASYGAMWLCQGDAWRAAAMHGDLPPNYIDRWRSGSWFKPGPNAPMPRAAASHEPVHIPDMRHDVSYREGGALPVSAVEVAGVRTLLCVPMIRENEVIGVITIYRKEVKPFTGKQVELVKNFGAQAVIAIENTRLLSELRESVQQQTATAEVLKTISSSTGQLEPVFNAMLENAVRICGAKFGSLILLEGNAYRRAALHNAPAAFVEARARDPVLPLAASPWLSRVAGTKQVIQVADIAAEHPEEPIVTLGGARTILSAPMLNDGRVVGVISIYRQEVLPFTDKQIELVKNFAAQAVIAIENARLLNELRQRTSDLSEALEQQTATADVLKVISSSPGALEPVFQTMLGNALHICESKFGIMYKFSDGAFQALSSLGNPPAYLIEHPHIVSEHPHNPLTRLVTTKEPIHISD